MNVVRLLAWRLGSRGRRCDLSACRRTRPENPKVTSTVERVRVGWVEQRRAVPAHLARMFLDVYSEAFDPLASLSPARQALSDDEFLAAMDDESVVKFVGWDRHERPHAMAIMTTDLGTVPWISLPYFEARFPDHHRRGAIYYFHALLVRPESHGGPWARLLLEELIRMVARDRAVAAFDSCSHTVEVARLPEMITRLANRLCIVDPFELDRQHYYGYVFEER